MSGKGGTGGGGWVHSKGSALERPSLALGGSFLSLSAQTGWALSPCRTPISDSEAFFQVWTSSWQSRSSDY